MVANVVLHQFGHEAVDGPARGGKTLEYLGARIVVMEAAQDAFELTDDFLGAIHQVELFL